MRGHTSGLAIPTFVVDLPGGGGKVPLQPNYIVSQIDGEVILRNYEGRTFTCRNPEPLVPNHRPDRQQQRPERVQPASREAVVASKGKAK
jgi:lysine 2,3-aminomutase